jgi:hypothetical protein
MNDTLLLIIGVVGLVAFLGSIWLFGERGERDLGRHKKCPRCHHKISRASWRCPNCGWTEEFEQIEVPPVEPRHRRRPS